MDWQLFWMFLLFVHLLVAALTAFVVIAERRSPPQATWAWVLSLLLLPAFGVALFLITGFRRYRRRKRLRSDSAVPGLSENCVGTSPNEASFEAARTAIRALCDGLTGFPSRSHNRVDVLFDGNHSLGEISKAISAAKNRICIEYFIFEADGTGAHFMDLLIAKTAEGVSCKLLMDDVGSYRFGRKSVRKLEEAGVHVARFGRLRLKRPWSGHLRNHRKLVVVDGEIAFCGSQNVGNGYLRWKTRAKPWTDVQLKISGTAAQDLEQVFDQDWTAAKGRATPTVNNTLTSENPRPSGSTEVQIFPTGPEDGRYEFEQLITSLLGVASRRVTISSPYLVPTLPIVIAMAAAVNRGVRVEILIPRESDHWFVDLAARGWFPELLRVGANIYLLPDRMPHEKVITVDESIAVVGSGNMDQRSFRLNYECGIVVYETETVRALLENFTLNLTRSALPFTEEDLARESRMGRFFTGLGKALSPVL